MAALNVSKISGMVGMAAAVTSMFKPQWSQVRVVSSWCSYISVAVCYSCWILNSTLYRPYAASYCTKHLATY
jgi:hypothetical protein